MAVLASLHTPLSDASILPDLYEAPGLMEERSYDYGSSNEVIDPFTGQLKRQYIDLMLPGNGGFDILIQRSYHSLTGRGGTTGLHYLDGHKLMPQGWDLHFGRVWTADGTTLGSACTYGITNGMNSSNNPVLELPDGTRKTLLLAPAEHPTATFITEDNWRGNCLSGGGLQVTSPEGVNYTFQEWGWASNGDFAYHPTQITDANGNSLTLTYYTDAQASYFSTLKEIRSNDGRLVTFQYYDITDTQRARLKSISTLGKTVTYNTSLISGTNRYKLDSVALTQSHTWNYTYKSASPGLHSLETVTSPTKQRNHYTYELVNFTGTLASKSQAVVTRKEIKRSNGTTIGTWTYSYQPGAITAGTDFDQTLVSGPNNCVRYLHSGAEDAEQSNNQLWRVGTLLEKELYDNPDCTQSLQKETYQWEKRFVSDQSRSDAFLATFPDYDYFVPMLTSRTITRDGTNYVTSYSSHDKYGNPGHIVETGQDSRTTDLTYYENTARWIVTSLKDETIAGLGSILRTYDDRGNLKTENRYNRTTKYEYFATGDISHITDPRQFVTTFSSYKRGIPQAENRPESVQVTRTVDDLGRITSETIDSKTTGYQYDSLDRVTAIITPRTDDNNISVGWTYFSSGGLRRTVTRGGYSRQTDYDEQGLPVFDSAEGITLERDYDADGRLTFRSNPNSNQGTRYLYDGLGRQIRVTDPANYQTITEYLAGNQVRVTDPRNQRTTYSYRSFGNPDQRDLIKIAAPEAQTTDIGRNLIGQLTSVTQGGKTRSFVRDSRLFIDYEVHPEVGTIDYTRDNNDNITYRRVGSNTGTTFAYTGLNQLKSIDYPGTTPDVSFTYYKSGTLKQASKGAFVWDYLYDSNDNLDKETLRHGIDSYVLDYGYDGNDALSSLTYPSGLSIGYSPDSLGRPTRAGNYVTDASYHPNGQLASMTLGNGVVTTLSQNSRLLPKRLTSTYGGTSLMDLDYGYDPAGNTQDITDWLNSTNNRSFSYDGLNRLNLAYGDWGSQDYGYDSLGNITSRTGSQPLGYSYDATKNRLTSVSGSHSLNFSYDGYGNITGNGQHSFSYDHDYNLREVDGGTIQYGYDAHNHRLTRLKNGQENLSLYSLEGKLLYEKNASGETTDYIYLGNHLVARRDLCGSADGDGDGLPDCFEHRNGLNAADPADGALDDDNDGLSNSQEYQYGTSPTHADTDNDGMPDGYEVNNGLNPLVNDATGDKDNDGLSNLGEYQAGTGIGNPDSDADGITDGYEVSNGLNPLIDDAAGDLDSDGVTNLAEFQSGLAANDPDSDNDGMPDGWELANGYDPMLPELNADPDGDGIPNGYEVNNGLDAMVNDAAGDKDGDGVTNLAEYQAGTKANAADSDYDGLPDGWELANGLNPLVNDNSADPDNDGLNNFAEYFNSTNPQAADTDADGLPDGYEVSQGLNPLANDAGTDSDRDGLSALGEYRAGTNPSDADSDDDGLPDGWEVSNGLNPLTNDAGSDPDGDTLTNLQEYQLGTNPKRADTDGDGLNDNVDPQPNFNVAAMIPVWHLLLN